MLRKLGPEGGLVPSSAGGGPPVPQAGGFLANPLPGLGCTSIGALLRTNWLSGIRREELSMLSVGESSSGKAAAPAAVLLMDLLRPEDMLKIACTKQSLADLHFHISRLPLHWHCSATSIISPTTHILDNGCRKANNCGPFVHILHARISKRL